MNPESLKENLTAQFSAVVEEIKTLETQMSTSREKALKLKGALEALDLLEQEPVEPVEPVEEATE
tara:strand:+ start:345 stop:539 length:195 start_codon:yes stop_codon:yes gene_type:complete